MKDRDVKTNLNKCVPQTIEEREGDSRETGELFAADSEWSRGDS